jgi:hypothetical protein
MEVVKEESLLRGQGRERDREKIRTLEFQIDRMKEQTEKPKCDHGEPLGLQSGQGFVCPNCRLLVRIKQEICDCGATIAFRPRRDVPTHRPGCPLHPEYRG